MTTEGKAERGDRGQERDIFKAPYITPNREQVMWEIVYTCGTDAAAKLLTKEQEDIRRSEE